MSRHAATYRFTLEELTALLALPDGRHIAGVEFSAARLTLDVVVAGPDLPVVDDGCEPPVVDLPTVPALHVTGVSTEYSVPLVGLALDVANLSNDRALSVVEHLQRLTGTRVRLVPAAD